MRSIAVLKGTPFSPIVLINIKKTDNVQFIKKFTSSMGEGVI